MQRWCCRWIQGQKGGAGCPGHPQPRCWGTPRAWVRLLRRGRRIQAAACGAGPSRCGAKPPAVLWGGCRSTGILQRGLRTQAQAAPRWAVDPTPQLGPHTAATQNPQNPRAAVLGGGPTHPTALPAPGCCCAQGALLPCSPRTGSRAGQSQPSCTVGSWPHSLGIPLSWGGAALPTPAGSPRGPGGHSRSGGRWGWRHFLQGWGSGVSCMVGSGTARLQG